MNDREIVFIPDRLNQQPIIFNGMTDSELKLAVGIALMVCLPLGTFLGFFLKVAMLGFGVGCLLAFLSTWLIGKRMRVLKRGRPEGYHADAISAWLEDRGIKPRTMIRESCAWDVTRH